MIKLNSHVQDLEDARVQQAEDHENAMNRLKVEQYEKEARLGRFYDEKQQYP